MLKENTEQRVAKVEGRVDNLEYIFNNKAMRSEPIMERYLATEQQVKDLVDNVDTILNNHLPHINGKLDDMRNQINDLEKKMAYAAGGLAALQIFLNIALSVFGK